MSQALWAETEARAQSLGGPTTLQSHTRLHGPDSAPVRGPAGLSHSRPQPLSLPIPAYARADGRLTGANEHSLGNLLVFPTDSSTP